MKRVAEIMYPMHTEIGESVIGAWISTPREIKGWQFQKLIDLIPEASFIHCKRTGVKIEVELLPKDRHRIAIMQRVKAVRRAIKKATGTTAGLCPVRSSTRTIRVTRTF